MVAKGYGEANTLPIIPAKGPGINEKRLMLYPLYEKLIFWSFRKLRLEALKGIYPLNLGKIFPSFRNVLSKLGQDFLALDSRRLKNFDPLTGGPYFGKIGESNY